MVDCRGIAPRSPACKADDLLNDRAAQKKWRPVQGGAWIGSGGGNRTRSQTAYEAAASPAGSPAVSETKMARRPGAAPVGQGFGDLAAQAGARRIGEGLKEIGAVSRNRTGIA